MKGYRAFKYKNIHNVVYIFCTSLLFICYLIFFNINITFANHTTPSLKIGSYSIEFNKEFDKYRLYVKKGDEILYSQDNPAILFICENENEVMYNAGYQDIIYDERYIIARASIKTRNNSIIEFEDRYSVNDEGLLFTRDTTVAYANERDIGFSTRFSLYQIKNTSLNDFNIFAPGVWYKQNKNAINGAFGTEYSDKNFLIKETRLALPMFCMQKVSDGESLVFSHIERDISSEQSEMSQSWLIDEGFKFGSLGITKETNLQLCFTYPSFEGDTNYYGNDLSGQVRLKGMIRRSHPVKRGVEHKYSLYIGFNNFDNFNEMQSYNWNIIFEKYKTEIEPIDGNVVYNNIISTLSSIYKDDFPGGGVGFPWSVCTLKQGVRDYHLQSGFVGQQTKLGWILFRDGLKNNNQTNEERGMKIIDFWVNNSMTESGIPRTDYFCEWNNGKGGWGTDPIFLRTVSDACEGVLDAYNTGLKYGTIKEDWLKYCEYFGTFLVNKQMSDGSWARSYYPNGEVVNSAKYNTTNSIRFLVRLYQITGKEIYKDTALKAGNWAIENVDMEYNYVGGTPDNDNTIDKEAGIMALNAFNSLYGITKNEKWLNAALNAANYLETWMYSYDYSAYPATRWAAENSSTPQWLMVDLGNEFDISRVESMFEFSNVFYQYKIETSLDKENWYLFIDKTNNRDIPKGTAYVDYGIKRKARYVKLTITKTQNNVWASVYEFRIYGSNGNNLSQDKRIYVSSEQEKHFGRFAVDGVKIKVAWSPWSECGTKGQSLVATGHSYMDTFMVGATSEYLELYLHTKNKHYADIANMCANLTARVSDFDGRLGYQTKALMGEGVLSNNFSVFYGEECLMWQLALQLETLCRLEDKFDEKNIKNILVSSPNLENLDLFEPTKLDLEKVDKINAEEVYLIVNKQSGKLIDVQGASKDNSANIWQYKYINGDGQKWRAKFVDNKYWEFENVNSGKVIDVEGFGTADGINISQFTNSHTMNQQWELRPFEESFMIINRNSGKVVDVVNHSYIDGANITQFTGFPTNNQLWIFYKQKSK